MPARRLRFRPAVSAIALLLAVFGTQQAHAGLFDDEEARRQINDLSIKLNDRVDTLSKAQIELVNQLQALREENAKLRGQVETLQYELESTRKRQQDFYVDLDGRVRKLETAPPSAAEAPKPAEGDTPPPAADAGGKKPAGDPAVETRDYEAALNLFKANKLKESASAFDAFTKAHPDGSLTPNAYFWLGNALAAQRDCKRAIDAYRVVTARWPQNAKAPDALIGVASCQQELGDAKSARTTLEAVLIKYPDSSAATTARQRLKK